MQSPVNTTALRGTSQGLGPTLKNYQCIKDKNKIVVFTRSMFKQ